MASTPMDSMATADGIGSMDTLTTNSNQDALGRFVKGNKAAVGRSPSARAIRRRKFQDIVIFGTREEDVAEIWAAVIVAAKDGEEWAVKLFFERTTGNAVERENAERLDELQSLMGSNTLCQSEAA